MLTEIKKHRYLLASIALLQAGTVMLPYVAAFEPTGVSLVHGWFADIRSNYYFWLLLLVTWFAAVPLVGLTGYWSSEIAEQFHLEVFRHKSGRSWIDRKLAVSALVCVVLGGLIPFVFLVATHQDDATVAAGIAAALVLYLLHLAILLIATILATGSARAAFVSVLVYHVANVIFDVHAMPNAIQYFLLGEHASGQTLCIAFVGLTAATWLLRACFTPSTIAIRGSDPE